MASVIGWGRGSMRDGEVGVILRPGWVASGSARGVGEVSLADDRGSSSPVRSAVAPSSRARPPGEGVAVLRSMLTGSAVGGEGQVHWAGWVMFHLHDTTRRGAHAKVQG